MLILTLLAIIFTSVISQELIVDNLQNQYVATGQSYHKDWSKIEWNNNLDFAIYGWFKISSQYVLDNWVVGFQFSSNDNSRLTDKSNLGDRDIPTPFYRYMNLQLQFQFIVQFCNQNGAKTAQEPLDIQLISNGVPNLSQTFSQFSKSILQINLKKYQIPLDQNLDIQALGLQDLAENKEQDNNNQKEFNLSRQQDEIKQFPNKGILKQRQESHFSQSQFTNPNIIQKDLPSQEQQNEKQYEKSPEQDIQIIELDQLEQKQDNQNQQLAKESKKHKKQILIIKQNEENQQFDSLNNQESQNSLQKKLQNQMLTLTNVYSNINTNQNIFSTSLIPQQQQNPSLNQFQINKANTNQQSSIMNLEQQQTSLVNNLDKLNYLDKQKEELQIEKLDQQSNNGISIEQDQNTNRKNSNNQQEQSIEQSKLAEEEQKLTEQYIIDKNLQKLFQKPLAIRIILYHDFFNIFYIYDNKMSRGIRLNIFYLRIIHSLCLTTIFDDSYNIFQKIVISILSSIILVTGVKIITLIHKIKRVGQKLSLVILLSLLVFYYYVILSIISGEEPSYANSKTVSFVLILGIDFLGTLTLVSILKLSLIYLSKKYLKNENKIFIKLYNLLDLKLQILNLAF
ncbi:hypothetical protein ABPG73_016953 [Tetrahymena malaccensis]